MSAFARLTPPHTCVVCVMQAERRHPLHAKVVQQATDQCTSEPDALQQFCFGATPSVGNGGRNTAEGEQAAYRRWCASRVAAGELQLLCSTKTAVDEVAAIIPDESSDESSDVDGNDSTTDDELWREVVRPPCAGG